MVNQESLNTQLATQARQAYDLKKTRESIALAKQLAEADPGNVEAQSILSAIRADIQQDLHDARALIEQFGSPDEKRKYRKAAEIILIKTLSIDPENVEASMLLQSARAVPAGSMPRAQKQAPAPQPSINVPQPFTRKEDEVPFVAASTLFENYKGTQKKKYRLKLPIGLIAVVLLGGGLIRVALSHRTAPDALAAPAATAESTHPINYKPRTETPAPKPVPAPASPAPAAAVTPPVVVPAPAATAPMGELSVNSAIAAEIYQGEKRLGTTPATLHLPAGHQILEYRHGDLKTVLNHTIKANETTNAAVTFQVTVQINAKPWAQVFVDGSPRRALGQTPLSGVNVPVGGVLVFENPNFTSKTYRITDKDTAIQVDLNRGF
jgi:hypothetical protein